MEIYVVKIWTLVVFTGIRIITTFSRNNVAPDSASNPALLVGDSSSSSSSKKVKIVDISNPIDFFLCHREKIEDEKQEASSSLFMDAENPEDHKVPKLAQQHFSSQRQESSLQLGQYGRIWTTIRNESLSSTSISSTSKDNLTNVNCKLELITCPNCLIELSWRGGEAVGAGGEEVVRGEFGAEVASRNVKCDPSCENGQNSCATIAAFEERPGESFHAFNAQCKKVQIFNAHIKTLPDELLLKDSVMDRNFTSSTNKLTLFVYSMKFGDVDSLIRQQLPYINYRIIENTIIRRGRPPSEEVFKTGSHSEGYIESPWFPKSYPQGVMVNYTLINEDTRGFVRLTFSDYQLHYMSNLKIYDTDWTLLSGSMSDEHSLTNTMRPCAIQSMGPKLTIIFDANHYSLDIGFRAHYKFTSTSWWPDKPTCKACDKMYDEKGGVIVLDQSIIDSNIYIDCIWLLTKSRFGSPLYDRLYVKIKDFSIGVDGKSVQLELRRGMTSQSEMILNLFGPKSGAQLARMQPQDGYSLELSDGRQVRYEQTGFYLRLKGYFGGYNGNNYGLAIVFAQYYKWATAVCHDQNEFHCENGRCIMTSLRCDGSDHCGDYSDESQDWCSDNTNLQAKIQQQINNNRNFPLVSFDSGEQTNLRNNFDGAANYPVSYTTTVILVSCLVGLILVMLMVTAIAARVYKQRLLRRLAGFRRSHGSTSGSTNGARLTEVGQSPTQAEEAETIGTRPGGPSIHQIGNRRLLIWPENSVGIFEAPPTYDDALKHPTVPPSANNRQQSIAADQSFVNLSFTGDQNQDDSLSSENNANESQEQLILGSDGSGEVSDQDFQNSSPAVSNSDFTDYNQDAAQGSELSNQISSLTNGTSSPTSLAALIFKPTNRRTSNRNRSNGKEEVDNKCIELSKAQSGNKEENRGLNIAKIEDPSVNNHEGTVTSSNCGPPSLIRNENDVENTTSDIGTLV